MNREIFISHDESADSKMNIIKIIKEKTAHFRYPIIYSQKRHVIILRPLYFAARFLILGLPGLPYSIYNLMKYRKHLHQWTNYTCDNRYPDLFAICKEFFKNRECVKILSFGCSTGEEVYSIQSYLPQATIIGADINPYNLRQCKKNKADKNIDFVHSLSEEYRSSKDFDAIFCLAVFWHRDNRTGANIATKFTFRQFEEQILEFDEKLKSGGVLFIDRADFDFMQTAVSCKYRPLEVDGNKIVTDRPLFDKNNIKVADKNDCYRVFLKKE